MNPAVLLVLVLCGVAAAKRDVLFFAVDDLRMQLSFEGPGVAGPGCPLSETLGCTKMVTPHLASLAATSFVGMKNYVQQAVCSPTRTSLLTSRRPDATHVWDLYSYFRTVGGNFTTLPEMFKINGYYTAGGGKIFHPGHASGMNKSSGLPGDDIPYSWNQPYFHAPNLQYPLYPDNSAKSWINVNQSTEERWPLPDTQIADNAISVLKAIKQQRDAGTDTRPFFVAVGFHKPHLPFIAPEHTYDLYPLDSIVLPADNQPPSGMPSVAWSDSGELVNYKDINEIRHGKNLQPGDDLPNQTVKELRRAYYAAVSHMDEQMGRVLQALKDLGFYDDVVISLFGDHGWQLGEHGEWCKHTNFELATRAPLLVRVPGLTDGGINSTEYTEHIDLFPTLAEAALNITVPPCPKGHSILTTDFCTMGRSLVPLMQQEQQRMSEMGGGVTALREEPGTRLALRADGSYDASFSQYPRGYQKAEQSAETTDVAAPASASSTAAAASFSETASPCLYTHCTMGYSVVTRIAGHEYRYTEWVDFNTLKYRAPNFDRNVGTELYDHGNDVAENFNVFDKADYQQVKATLAALLHKGPDSSWGPWNH
eukprot:m.163765 g.163765  ORF g.163765 m.163765 type:complete len:594 (+) comp21042_c0_seq1:28-1809(+)